MKNNKKLTEFHASLSFNPGNKQPARNLYPIFIDELFFRHGAKSLVFCEISFKNQRLQISVMSILTSMGNARRFINYGC